MNIAHGGLTKTGREHHHACKEVTDIGSDLLSFWLLVCVSSAAETCTRSGCLVLVWFYFIFLELEYASASPLTSNIPCSKSRISSALPTNS